MSARPTPGPWEWEARHTSLVVRSQDCSICNLSLHTNSKKPLRPRIEREANARLIAQAGTVYHETQLTPRQLADQRAELLAALRRLVGNAGALGAFEDGIRECAGNTNWQCLIEAIHAADAAIAKAGAA